jgi:hypothetical protein
MAEKEELRKEQEEHMAIQVVLIILLLGCPVISVAFNYSCGYFSLFMPYWL